MSGKITDREIAGGNYCYSTIKLYILGGITPDRADHSSAPNVCVCVCVFESECETLSVYQGHWGYTGREENVERESEGERINEKEK